MPRQVELQFTYAQNEIDNMILIAAFAEIAQIPEEIVIKTLMEEYGLVEKNCLWLSV